MGVFELLEINDDIRDLVQDRANASRIRKAGTAKGMKLLHADGLEKAQAGITTVDEVCVSPCETKSRGRYRRSGHSESPRT